jgi:outer membrane immunogenic protein
MKKFLLGSVGLAAMLAGPAMAADMRVAPPPPPVVYYDWSGAYVGFNAGGVWTQINQHYRDPGVTGFGQFGGLGPVAGQVANDVNTNNNEGIYGFHAGAQWQWGAWVLGAEAALSGCWNECRSLTDALAPGFTANTGLEHKMTNLFTAGGKIGYAWDRWMIFATGGWASANLKNSYCNTVTGVCGPTASPIQNGIQDGASRNDGWYAGGGLDFMVHKGALVDVLLGVEYQHFDVSNERAFCAQPGCNVPNVANYDLGAKGDLVRARLTIKSQGYGWFAIR